MFLSVYKTTLKNLFRSVIFWSIFAFLLFISLYEAIEGGSGYYDPTLRETIMDTDPRYVVDYANYITQIQNTCIAWVMLYAMPIFTVVSTVLVLNRDYGDGFYEIEKSGGVKPRHYVLGRLAALVTVNFVAVVLAMFLSLHWYIFTRGGVSGMSLWTYLGDSFVRVMRFIVFMSLPAILFYIGFTYVIGNVFKNSLPAAAAGLAYILGNYLLIYMFRHSFSEVYFDYLCPIPYKIRYYLYYYDTSSFGSYIIEMDTSLGHVAVCVGLLVGVAVIYSAISYWRIRRRET